MELADFPTGYLLVGHYAEVESVKYGASNAKAGQAVEGLYRLSVYEEPFAGERVTFTCTVRSYDRDTGERTKAWECITEERPMVGELVAVKVRLSAREGGTFVEKEAVRITILSRVAAAKASNGNGKAAHAGKGDVPWSAPTGEPAAAR